MTQAKESELLTNSKRLKKRATDKHKKIYKMAADIKMLAQEVEQAARQGKCIGRNAYDFLAEIRKGTDYK